MNRRDPTVRTSTVWPFLYTVLPSGKTLRVVPDKDAPPLQHVKAPRKRQRIKIPKESA